MLRVKSIKTNLVVSGLYMGYPATVIKLLRNGKNTEQNEVVDAIKENGHKTVVIKGAIMENPEVKTLITGLSSIGHTVIVCTDGADDIGPVRGVRNCYFQVKITPPSSKGNNNNVGMLGYLKPEDELLFVIDSEETYTNSLSFLTARIITKPTVTFMVEEDELKDKILADSIKFRFKCRILQMKIDEYL